jgi:hypothetical protein
MKWCRVTAIIIRSFHWGRSSVLFRSLFCKRLARFKVRARLGRNDRPILRLLFRLSALVANRSVGGFPWRCFRFLGRGLGATSGFGGAWHIALGFALLGQVGALYFVLARACPLIGGFFFALAFGNRTELILTLPIYLYYLWFPRRGDSHPATRKEALRQFRKKLPALLQFSMIPVTLAPLFIILSAFHGCFFYW